jgi:hypothetical protein
MRENYQKPMKNWQFESADKLPFQQKPTKKETDIAVGNTATKSAAFKAPAAMAKLNNPANVPQKKTQSNFEKAFSGADEATKAPKKKIRIRDLPEAEQIRWKNIHKGK